MKDIVITSKKIKREWIILALCFVVACIINIIAIIIYDRPWNELFTQIGFVITISVVLYVILFVLRLIICGLAKLFRKR